MHEADNRTTTAADMLRQASEGHAWRALSFVAALRHIGTSADAIEPDSLLALTDALAGHVKGLVDAIDDAQCALGGVAGQSA